MGKITAHFDLDCGCCPGGAPYLIVGECQSLTGTATLCGFSGYSADASPYDPLLPEEWEGQYRKWRYRALSGGFEYFTYNGPGCETECQSGVQIDYDGTAEITCASSTGVSVDVYGGCVPTFIQTEVVFESLLQVDGTETKTLTSRTITYSGACYSETPESTPSITTGETTDTLSDERYLYDALEELQAGSPEEVESGDSCCASTTAADLTTPESIGPISLTGTAVRVPITVFGCDPVGAEVTVYVTLSQDGSEYVVPIVLLCQVPGFYYVPQPPPGDPEICFVSASLDP